MIEFIAILLGLPLLLSGWAIENENWILFWTIITFWKSDAN
jgi:hypothetical protein